MNRNNKKILFFSNVKNKEMFSIQRFYSIDIKILKDLGFEVKLSNSILDFFKFWEYEVVLIYFYRIGLIGAFIATLFRKNVFFTGGIDFLDRDYASFKSYFIQKVLFKFCNAFSRLNLIVSSSDLINVKSIFKNGFNNYVFCPHVIDFYPSNNSIKKKIITTIVWMGNDENVYRKGILNSIRLFKSIYNLDPEFRMFIIGYKGKGTFKVEKYISDHNLNGIVILTGSINEDEKIKILQTSTLYFQLSVFEGFGIAAIEALALGNIVVHSGKGGLKDGISDFGICLDISVEDFNEWAIYILDTITDVNKSNLLISGGIRHINENFVYKKRLDIFSKYLN